MAGKVTDFSALTTLADNDVFYVVQVSDGTDKKITKSNATASLQPSGMIAPFAMASAPTGWLLADGSAVSRTTYANLFSAIGVTWGAGDSSTTFNLPDLRGAFVRGAGSNGSQTMANGSAFAGPAVGSYENDQMQGHHFECRTDTGGTPRNITDVQSGGGAAGFGNTATTPYLKATNIVTDGTNGTPRTGYETKPFAAGVYYCIKT